MTEPSNAWSSHNTPMGGGGRRGGEGRGEGGRGGDGREDSVATLSRTLTLC